MIVHTNKIINTTFVYVFDFTVYIKLSARIYIFLVIEMMKKSMKKS